MVGRMTGRGLECEEHLHDMDPWWTDRVVDEGSRNQHRELGRF